MQKILVYLFSVVVVIVTLAFGLVSYDDYASQWINYEESQSETVFGKYGLAHGEFPELENLHGTNNNLEFTFQMTVSEPTDSSFQVIMQISEKSDGNPIAPTSEQLVVGQWQKYIIVMQGEDYRNEFDQPRLSTNIEAFFNQEITLRILFNDQVNTMYVNGIPVSTHSPSTYQLERTNAKISVGNSLNGKHGWAGSLRSLEIVFQDTTNTTNNVVRAYRFDLPNSDGSVSDSSAYSSELTIPKVGWYPESLFLNDRDISDLLKEKPIDIVLNLVGFAPIALAVAITLSVAFVSIGNTAIFIITVLACTAASLFIEYSQQFIAGRNSDLHDLMLNVAGALLGLLVFFLIKSWALKLLVSTHVADLQPAASTHSESE